MADTDNNNYTVDEEIILKNAERKQKLKILLEKGGEIGESFSFLDIFLCERVNIEGRITILLPPTLILSNSLIIYMHCIGSVAPILMQLNFHGLLSTGKI